LYVPLELLLLLSVACNFFTSIQLFQNSSSFWATVCKTVRPMLLDRCLSVCPVMSVCNVGALWPNGLTDQDETWHAGRPRSWPHCVPWGPSSSSPKGAQSPPIFGPYPLQSNRCIDQDATWYGGRPRPKRLCVRWGPCSPSPKKGAEPPKFLAHVYCGETAGWIKMVLGHGDRPK